MAYTNKQGGIKKALRPISEVLTKFVLRDGWPQQIDVARLIRAEKSGAIRDHPCQRGPDRWPPKTQEQFIAAILNGAPIPGHIVLIRREDDTNVVHHLRGERIDGQQRMRTLTSYFSEKYQSLSDVQKEAFETAMFQVWLIDYIGQEQDQRNFWVSQLFAHLNTMGVKATRGELYHAALWEHKQMKLLAESPLYEPVKVPTGGRGRPKKIRFIKPTTECCSNYEAVLQGVHALEGGYQNGMMPGQRATDLAPRLQEYSSGKPMNNVTFSLANKLQADLHKALDANSQLRGLVKLTDWVALCGLVGKLKKAHAVMDISGDSISAFISTIGGQEVRDLRERSGYKYSTGEFYDEFIAILKTALAPWITKLDSARTLSPKEREARLIAQDFSCAGCNKPLPMYEAEAAHPRNEPFRSGGRTSESDMLCHDCHQARDR